MKTFCALLLLGVCVATVHCSIDDDLEKEWKKHKEAILNRLEQYRENAEMELQKAQEKVEKLYGEAKQHLRDRIDVLVEELKKVKEEIEKLRKI